MSLATAMVDRLTEIPGLFVRRAVPLCEYTRFQIGGPAELLIETEDPNAFCSALGLASQLGISKIVIGGGSNLVVSDEGFDGLVLRYTGTSIVREGTQLTVQSGVALQEVVDFSVGNGLEGMQTMTGIPGQVSGALYGNAGAYGHSIQEVTESILATDGEQIREFSKEECGFRYRESFFKSHKEWIILSGKLRFQTGDAEELTGIAHGIRAVRDEKYPPTMKCAGSIFKNLIFASLPDHVQAMVPPKLVREGKVPSAWFLEQTEVKGMRVGDIQVAEYHANLIYNDGKGTAADLMMVISELKKRVRDRFGFDIEEEVQYVGFDSGGR